MSGGAGEGGGPAWYPVRTKPKAEHLAVACLRQVEGLEAFCPRIRFLRATRRGKVWFEEALFPGYAFARFALREVLRRVNATHHVLGVVRFGDEHPALSEAVVESVRRQFPEEEPVVVEPRVEVGEQVEVCDGPMRGAEVTVLSVPDGKRRVRVLMELLGAEREVEVPLMSLLGLRDVREFVPGDGRDG